MISIRHVQAVGMHIPSAHRIDDGPDGVPLATLLPILWEHDRVIAHMARANPQWRSIAPGAPALLREAVSRLTAAHESSRAQPWQVGDAPGKFIDGQLGGIVGLEVTVTEVEGKAKLSQNRSKGDRRGVVTGLRSETQTGAADVAAAMERDL